MIVGTRCGKAFGHWPERRDHSGGDRDASEGDRLPPWKLGKVYGSRYHEHRKDDQQAERDEARRPLHGLSLFRDDREHEPAGEGKPHEHGKNDSPARERRATPQEARDGVIALVATRLHAREHLLDESLVRRHLACV